MTDLVSTSLGETLESRAFLHLVSNRIGPPPGKNTLDLYGGLSQSPTTSFNPLTGTTITLADNIGLCLINPTGALSALTLNMPTTPTSGQHVQIMITQAITTLTHSGNGNNLVNAFSSPVSAGATARWTYDRITATWYGVGLAASVIPGGTYTRTTVDNAASPYTVLLADDHLAVNVSAGPVTLVLPLISTLVDSKKRYTITDESGGGQVNNITIIPSGSDFILGETAGSGGFVMNTNWQSISVYANESNRWHLV